MPSTKYALEHSIPTPESVDRGGALVDDAGSEGVSTVTLELKYRVTTTLRVIQLRIVHLQPLVRVLVIFKS